MFQELDKHIFIWLNQQHHVSIDTLMVLITEKWTWLPWYGLWIIWLFYRYRGRLFTWLVCLALLVTLADQVSASLIKPFFARLRPCHEASLQEFIYLLIPNCGGRFGFVSSHAANASVLAIWMSITIFKQNKLLQFIWVFWAVLVSYSRIYVGVHYPGDILGGWVLGTFLALGMKYFNTYFSLPITGLYKSS